MPLSVKDILEKTFKRSFKGYDEDEVDKFLDQIIDEFKELQNENAMMKNELASLREHARKVKEAEETIMNTLVSAQKSAERIISDASRKAETVISNAESTARKRADAATQELADAQVKLQELKSCAQGFATSFANMVNAQASHFEKTFQSYFGKEEQQYGGINTEALHRIDKDMAQSMKDMPGLEMEEDSDDLPEAAPVVDLPESVSVPSFKHEEVPAQEGRSDFIELHEINRMLGALESGMFPSAAPSDVPSSPIDNALQPEQAPSQPQAEATTRSASKSAMERKPKYDDYSWIYENDEKQDDFSLSFKNPREKEDLKSLIDEIID